MVVGRPLSRIYLALSHVTMNISRDFGWLSWIESGRFRPLLYFAPSGLKKKCVEIRCKELYYIFLIFVLLHLFQIRHVRNFYCINSKHNFLYSTSFSCTVKVPGMCNFKLHKWTSRSSIKKIFFKLSQNILYFEISHTSILKF